MINDWAMVVGINKYPKARGAQPLQGAVYDAMEFRKWLLDPLGGDVPKDHIGKFFQKSNSSGQDGPVRSHLTTFIEQNFLSLLPNRPFGRRIYLYFSGHGISPTGQESIRNAALLMANAIMPHPLFHVPGNILAKGMRDSAYFREVVLIMDCCRDLEKNETPDTFGFFDAIDDGRVCVLVNAYATNWGRKAREITLPPDNMIRGVFTYSLLEVLKSGRMPGDMLKMSVQQHLARTLKDEKKPQETSIGPDEELPKIIFNEAADPPHTPVTIHGYSADQPPVIYFFPKGSDTSKQIAMDDWIFEDPDWKGFLEPRTYELSLPTGNLRKLHIYAGVPEEVNL